MACFAVPAVEAVVVTVANAVVKRREKKGAAVPEKGAKLAFSRKLKWLSTMLWGGSFLLAFEHVWHGEVTPWFPFLTAAGSEESLAEMLHEMATSGVLMAALVTAVWAGLVLVSSVLEKRAPKMEETK